MTVDDESSIYVGGLPYDATEESIRRIFDLYGAVVAVKIINDRGIGGKCYGFVTFTNPRSAIDAINDMDGQTIAGRIVRVNEVKTRGGRSNFGREAFRRNNERGMDWDRDRERDYDHYRDRYRNRNRDRSRDHDMDRERAYEHVRDRDPSRDHYADKDRELSRDMDEYEHERSRIHEREFQRNRDLERDHDEDIDRASERDRDADKDKNQYGRRRNSSTYSDHHSTELSSDSSGDYLDQVKEQMKMAKERLEELGKEIPQMEERLEEKHEFFFDLQKKSQKLEDSLTSARKLSSQRKLQLNKLHKCFMQVKDCRDRLKCSEQELESLVDTAMMEVDMGADV